MIKRFRKNPSTGRFEPDNLTGLLALASLACVTGAALAIIAATAAVHHDRQPSLNQALDRLIWKSSYCDRDVNEEAEIWQAELHKIGIKTRWDAEKEQWK